MSQGMRALFENAVPSLVLAIVVLVAGVGYGFYERYASASAAPAGAETAVQNASN